LEKKLKKPNLKKVEKEGLVGAVLFFLKTLQKRKGRN
jgi:hypothetical protein